MKEILKAVANGVCWVLTYVPAAICAFGRCERLFASYAQFYAKFSGLRGEYLRRAFYRHTLRSCSKTCCIAFGTFFSHPQAVVEDGVYIGAYCIIGGAHIGANTQIASNVYILRGGHEHSRDGEGHILGCDRGAFADVTIGADCWIGTSAVIMADVGERTTIGAGSLVTKAIPAGVVAVGTPARAIRST